MGQNELGFVSRMRVEMANMTTTHHQHCNQLVKVLTLPIVSPHLVVQKTSIGSAPPTMKTGNIIQVESPKKTVTTTEFFEAA